jgi:hypothetical protein
MTEDMEVARYVAQQQSIMDALTRKIYGPRIKFERLSAFGQNTIETLARDSKLLMEHPALNPRDDEPELRAKVARLEERLEEALRENQDLWEENGELKLEALEREDAL